MKNTQIQPGHQPKLFHVQTNTPVELPPNRSVIHIGKAEDSIQPDIDVSNLPNSYIVSRTHATISLEGDHYFIEDVGSSNGTYLNGMRLAPANRHLLNPGDKIELGKDSLVTFIFEDASNLAVITNPETPETLSEQETFVTKLTGTGLILAGFAFLSSSLWFSHFALPFVIVEILGVLTVNYGGRKRHFGWLLIAAGVAIAVMTHQVFVLTKVVGLVVLAILSLFCGYQLFVFGKVKTVNLLAIKRILVK
ncbi:MAG: FHA domain-containing protein [Coleofasciculus sp. C1-SOL-03]|jgi:hypothetical protein|uniref:FHA domain-containing protein n=1 Tax=Coleofasciculus sp. C1-SOL-03 TaxID=3069522 RepID=UPI0032FD9BBB